MTSTSSGGSPASRPSKFWDRLGEEHGAQLAQFGYDNVKRHQALKYFTWSWRWSQLAASEQFRFLMKHTSPRLWLAAVHEPMDLSDESWDGVDWKRSDRWLYCVATRLLWEYARARDELGILELPEPDLGNPLPVRWRGRLVSQDLANSALELAAIMPAVKGRVPKSIVEVGVGYGRTAYAILSLLPQARYTLIDIEPALGIAEWYLSKLFPDRELVFLTPADADRLDGASVDLALSISSLQEMTMDQIAYYLQLFDRTAAGGVVYLKQWRTWFNPEDEISVRFDDYPIPPGWTALFKEPAPVQTRFVEAAWTVPSRPFPAPPAAT